MIPADRCMAFVGALATTPGVDGPVIADEDAVLAAVVVHGITSDDFLLLDEQPGLFDADYWNSGWHIALRRARNNRDNDLFDRIAANTAAKGA